MVPAICVRRMKRKMGGSKNLLRVRRRYGRGQTDLLNPNPIGSCRLLRRDGNEDRGQEDKRNARNRP